MWLRNVFMLSLAGTTVAGLAIHHEKHNSLNLPTISMAAKTYAHDLQALDAELKNLTAPNAAETAINIAGILTTTASKITELAKQVNASGQVELKDVSNLMETPSSEFGVSIGRVIYDTSISFASGLRKKRDILHETGQIPVIITALRSFKDASIELWSTVAFMYEKPSTLMEELPFMVTALGLDNYIPALSPHYFTSRQAMLVGYLLERFYSEAEASLSGNLEEGLETLTDCGLGGCLLRSQDLADEEEG